MVNFAASRSFEDASAYPVFPWVISDYKKDRFPTASDTNSWRDLSKPVGALSEDKIEQFRAKYFEIVNKDPSQSPFLKDDGAAYMSLSHYSTGGIVMYYLIRKYPQFLVRIQNEALGVPIDRIFHDINISW